MSAVRNGATGSIVAPARSKASAGQAGAILSPRRAGFRVASVMLRPSASNVLLNML